MYETRCGGGAGVGGLLVKGIFRLTRSQEKEFRLCGLNPLVCLATSTPKPSNWDAGIRPHTPLAARTAWPPGAGECVEGGLHPPHVAWSGMLLVDEFVATPATRCCVQGFYSKHRI